MAGIIVELILSWLLLWLVCRKHLSVLGFSPTQNRITNLFVGLLIAASCCTAYQLLSIAFIDNNWKLNPKSTAKTIWEGTRYTLLSVLYEELIFRGALLYIAIKKLGVVKACMLSAVCFGIYHWFSFNVFGNPLGMVIIFLMTAIVGLSWAYAFAKTGSMYLPVGLHLGWNIFAMVVFKTGNFGDAILVKANENRLQGWLSWFVFGFQVFALPLLTFWYLRWVSKRQNAAAEQKFQPPQAVPPVMPENQE